MSFFEIVVLICLCLCLLQLWEIARQLVNIHKLLQGFFLARFSNLDLIDAYRGIDPHEEERNFARELRREQKYKAKLK